MALNLNRTKKWSFWLNVDFTKMEWCRQRQRQRSINGTGGRRSRLMQSCSIARPQRGATNALRRRSYSDN